jgi:2,4-dienoyl-CoA reductase-like NADH-dependent reductase (Old Yellow Enzyme family)
MSKAFPHLFEPFVLRGVELRNRVVFLPHVTFFAERQRPSERHRHYLEERARGGVGLIVTESQVVHPTGGHGKCIDASDREAMLAWGPTIDAVTSHGARIFAQLTHHGVEAFTADTLLPQWAPSAIANPAVRETPKEMTTGEIAEVQRAFRRAAGFAIEAGFEGVELKVGHDGLLRTFLSPFYNRRDDEYGHQSPENRVRFVIETLATVRDEIGDVPLGIRLCLDERFPGGYGLDEGVAIAQAIAETGLIDYLSADMGTWISADAQVPPASVPEGFADAATGAARRATGLPTIAFGRIVCPGHAESLLENGTADLIGMARQLLADPEWVRKVHEERPEDIRPCIHCNQECVGRLMRELPISCVHNPAAGREKLLGVATLTRASRRKRVVVVGGGPAGLKAAEVAAERGHEVVLLEREHRLGGQVARAASAPGNAEWGEIAVHLARRVERCGVDVRLGVDASADLVLCEGPDHVIVATGSEPGPWPFEVAGGAVVLDHWSALAGDDPSGQRVLVLDLGVRHEGATVVEALAHRGNSVIWVAPTPAVGIDVDPATLPALLARLAALGVSRVAETTVLAVDRAGVTTLNVFERRPSRIDGVETIVVAGNRAAINSLMRDLDGEVPSLRAVGDCVAPRHVAIAIYEGELAGRAA